MIRTALAALTLTFAVATAGSAMAAGDLRVVVTIKPVHSLAAAVMEGAGTPELLIKGAGSPHSYAMRPSEARLLGSADIVIRVSPFLETFLEKPLTVIANDSRMIISLDELAGVTLLPVREGGAFEGHDHGKEAGREAWHTAGPGHEPHAGHDAHLWLSTANASVIVDQLAAIFAKARPAQAELFLANAARFKARLAELRGELRDKLAPVRDRPFVVFHDAYQYFEAEFGLRSMGSITLSPERQVGAARIAAIRAKIAQSGSACVFSEPQFEPKLVVTVLEGSDAKKGVLDPLGADLPEGKEQYFQLLRNLAGGLSACLGASS
jgi:zinc transport system substrate-binding protein